MNTVAKLPNRAKRFVLFAACIVALAALVGVAYRWFADRRDLAATPPPGVVVDVGGHRLHVWCRGEAVPGAPTVLFDSGLGDDAFAWAAIAPEVAKFTKACTYDRAGMGYSDPGPTPRASGQIAKELTALIENGPIDSPAILVGLSFGGFNTRIVASERPDLVAGLVLVSASHEDQGARYAVAGVPSGRPPEAFIKLGPIAASLGILRLAGVTLGGHRRSAPMMTCATSFSRRLIGQVATRRWRASLHTPQRVGGKSPQHGVHCLSRSWLFRLGAKRGHEATSIPSCSATLLRYRAGHAK